MNSKIPRYHRVGLILALLPLGITLWVLPFVSHTMTPASLVALLVCIVIFALNDLLAGAIEQGLWAGYLYFTIIVAWMALGLPAALLTILAGIGIASGIRLWRREHLSFFPVGAVHPVEVAELAIARLMINGLPIIGVHLIHLLTGKSTPVLTLEVSELVALTPALLTGLMITKLAAMLLLTGRTTRPPSEGMMLELLLLIVAPVAAAVFSALGSVSFTVLMGLSAAQAIRYRQVSITQQSLLRRVEQLSTLDSLGQALASSIRVEDVLTTIHQRISKIVNFSVFYIALYDEWQDMLEFPLVMEEGDSKYWAGLPITKTPLTGWIIKQGKSLHITQNTAEYHRQHGLPLPAPHTTFAGFPLIAGDKTLGALCMTSFHAGGFTPDEISTVQTIAHQAGLVIRNAVLYNRSVQTTENLTRVNEFTQRVVLTLETGAVLEMAAQTVQEITRADRIALFLARQDQRNRYELAHSLNLTTAYREKVQNWLYDFTRYTTGSLAVTDVDTSNDESLKALAKLGEFKATAEIPMRSGNVMVGIIVTYHNKSYYYRKSDLGLLEALANQITAALDNAELLKTLEGYASEQAQLVYLSRISTSQLELQSVIKNVLDLMRALVGEKRVYIGLLDSNGEHIIFYGMAEESKIYPCRDVPEFYEQMSIPKSFTRADASTGLAQMMDECGDTSMVLAPMLANNDNLGVISLGSPMDFDINKARLLEVATNQIASQIHNIQQYEYVEDALNRRLQQLSLIEDIARQISSALHVEQLISHVLEAAIRATQADMAALALLSDEGIFEIIGQECIDGEWHTRTVERPAHVGVMGRVAQSGKPEIIVNNAQVADYISTFSPDRYRSSLVVPLLKEQTVLGILNIESIETDFFTEEHVDFVLSLAGHAVITIQNARLHERILAGNNRMRAILDATSDGIILLDRNVRLIETNISAEHILGIDLQDRIGENFVDMLLQQLETEYSTPEMVESLQSMGRILRLEPERITRRQYELKKHNHAIFVEEIGSPVMDGNHQIMGRLIVLRDITEERRLAAYRDEITNMVVHDLRSPIAGIISGLNVADEIAEQDLQEIPSYDVLKSVLDISVNNAQSLLELVNSILDIAKRESADWTLNITPIRVEDLISGALLMMQPLVQEAGLVIEQHFSSKVSFVGADRDEIRRVLFNLLDNAIRYSPSGGKIWINTELVEGGSKALIRIANTGTPIPAEERERVFEKFRQVPGNLPLHGRKGSGLGLNFCKLVIEAHGGKIWVEAEGPFDGASFVFTLPVVTEPTSLT